MAPPSGIEPESLVPHRYSVTLFHIGDRYYNGCCRSTIELRGDETNVGSGSRDRTLNPVNGPRGETRTRKAYAD